MPAFTIDPASGGYRAHFWGDNNRLVWWTQTYERKQSAQDAIDLIKRHASTAPVYDQTKAA